MDAIHNHSKVANLTVSADSSADTKKTEGSARKLFILDALNHQGLFNIKSKSNNPNTPALTKQETDNISNSLNSIGEGLALDIYAVMAALQKNAQEMRSANRVIRASELNAQVGDLMQAAKEMKTAAKYRMIAGVVQGSIQVASGAIQLGGSIASGIKAGQASQRENLALGVDRKIASGSVPGDQISQHKVASDTLNFKATSLRNDASAISDRAKGSSDILSGAGNITASVLNYHADLADAKAKRLEAGAKLHESASSEANEMMQQMMDVIRDVREKLSAIDQSRIETNRAISRNI